MKSFKVGLIMTHGFVIWLTGLSGSGKTTIARELEAYLTNNLHRVEVLDGDIIRQNLSPDLGFSKEDREVHNKRVIFLAKLLSRNDVVVIIPLISPYRVVRDFARGELGRFLEVFVKCSIETCIQRDPKGLYKKALAGEITKMTGIDDPYEEPLNPDVIVDTDKETPKESAHKIIDAAKTMGYLS
jgi:adenylylsulfate kinase